MVFNGRHSNQIGCERLSAVFNHKKKRLVIIQDIFFIDNLKTICQLSLKLVS